MSPKQNSLHFKIAVWTKWEREYILFLFTPNSIIIKKLSSMTHVTVHEKHLNKHILGPSILYLYKLNEQVSTKLLQSVKTKCAFKIDFLSRNLLWDEIGDKKKKTDTLCTNSWGKGPLLCFALTLSQPKGQGYSDLGGPSTDCRADNREFPTEGLTG